MAQKVNNKAINIANRHLYLAEPHVIVGMSAKGKEY